MLILPIVHIGVRHGWFWSAVLGAFLGYSAREGGINSRALIWWLVLAGGVTAARPLNFVVDEPEWWVTQVEIKGLRTVAWNTIWGVLSFAVLYAVIMGVAGLVAYGVAVLL